MSHICVKNTYNIRFNMYWFLFTTDTKLEFKFYFNFKFLILKLGPLCKQLTYCDLHYSLRYVITVLLLAYFKLSPQKVLESVYAIFYGILLCHCIL